MAGASLKGRAFTFALCAGLVAFVLALAATFDGQLDRESIARALIPAIVCATFCWASAQRQLATVAEAIDAAIARLERAGHGDLDSPLPRLVGERVPKLGNAIDALFRQIAANLESVHRLAMFDPVTGLPNRTHFRRSAERLLCDVTADQRAALLFVDLDRFKSVNDTLGHAMGDMLLGMVANRLRAVAERFAVEGAPAPSLGRLAGDEFTLFLPQLANKLAAERVARGVLFALSESFELADTDVSIGASIGVAWRPDHGANLTDLMRAADAAMYEAKARGRGRVELFSDKLASELAERAQLEADLREAIDRREFSLAFQPQVATTTGEIVAAEALLRWQHPRLGLTLPGSFIKRAEETGLIVEIGEWVIETIAETIARWGRKGIEQRLAINISARQLDQSQFFHQLRAAMRAADAPARLLELEITETLAMHCGDETLAAITALRDDGARIAIDDFGTGYSNLARLSTLPVDRVKLDRSLIEPITGQPQARAIVQAMIGLIHGLGCEVVAEGIETLDQAKMLRLMGCDVIQGYAIARPMPEEAFITWSQGSKRWALAG
ncbi:MAG: response regulator PleD [Proteobacteria bacterium SG_bin6]|nr:MAG: response regulator PleD [Proteobacteria bacterium SG_bin6]